jgi:hypothetical protein
VLKEGENEHLGTFPKRERNQNLDIRGVWKVLKVLILSPMASSPV